MAPCERCGKSGVYRVSEGGVERWVCESCLEIVLGGIPLADIASALSRVPRPTGRCPFCGTTSEEAVTTGLVGCPLCYEALDASVWREMGIERTPWTRMDVW